MKKIYFLKFKVFFILNFLEVKIKILIQFFIWLIKIITKTNTKIWAIRFLVDFMLMNSNRFSKFLSHH